MLPRYDLDSVVRVIRNLRNDGTYPGLATGELLIRRGSVGQVRNVGTFLQDQLIYTVHFLAEDILVGCREEELIPGDAPWVASRFEARERVTPASPLGIRGQVVARPGDVGEVLKVLRQQPVAYHVRFLGRTLQVPETALSPLDGMEIP